MELKSTDLTSLFEKALREIERKEPTDDLTQVGFVVQAGDASCKVHGLFDAVFGELLEFEGGNKGIVLDLKEDYCTVFLLYTHISVQEQEAVRRTGTVFKIPVGEKLLGRVMNAVGQPLDGFGPLQATELRPIEVSIPGIVERSPINESLETGITVVDALVPIGRGQRELLIGNRNTGKTAIALDAIVHQRTNLKKVYCIYVSIGQRQANTARIAQYLESRGALEYTVIVSADAAEAAINRYLAPYVGTTIAEYFRDRGDDVLIVYDDLSNHAIAYREISLLMRRPPGREAYPGDVFYVHSRLLERAGKLLKGGSITALPIVQIQGDDIAAYIPTNLISITDGQIFLDTKLFNAGMRPAVNVELSVSRVGGSAQTKAMKQVTRALRLELAQYHELLGFSQFGTELDFISQRRLARGAIIVELLKQEQGLMYTFVDQVLRFYLLRENLLDALPIAHVRSFAEQYVSYVKSVYEEVYERIERTEEISTEDSKKLYDIALEFGKIFAPMG
jgi:F-type H+/Na+-transporting ATPase subunit alpha